MAGLKAAVVKELSQRGGGGQCLCAGCLCQASACLHNSGALHLHSCVYKCILEHCLVCCVVCVGSFFEKIKLIRSHSRT